MSEFTPSLAPEKINKDLEVVICYGLINLEAFGRKGVMGVLGFTRILSLEFVIADTIYHI